MSTFHSFEMSATHEHFCHDNFVDNAFVTSLFLLSGLRSAQIDHRVERKRIMPWKSCICPLHPVNRLFFGIGWSGQHFLQAPTGLFSFVEDKFAYPVGFRYGCLRFVTVPEMIYHLQVFSLFDILVGIALSHRPG